MGPLIPVAVSLLPSLAKWLAGDKAGEVAARAAGVVQAVTGSADPNEVAMAISDPVKATELRIRLAEIEHNAEAAEYADRANAREMAGKSSLIAWAQVSGAGIVLVLFGSMLMILAFRGAPTDQAGLFYYALGILSALVTQIGQFFYGNSTAANSANARMDQLASKAPLLALPAPPAAIAGPVTTDSLNDAALAQARAGR
jgi:hypothetical protein